MDARKFTNANGTFLAGLGGYKGFVPHALFPSIAWNAVLARDLSTADQALGRLAGTGQSLLNPGY